ncbi:flagellar biosynthesis protein FlhF [Ideonella sp. B7]|uniref:flagellar biosynthesis protein FlhF n=1 Tax=Ideonella benzenivorans TaxID=2831643 RepID=UPI001CED0510|nr:flagellar biosynthesis protein FlhF [Ideonella benzenivorans]MCA6217966.1 flagellar biosynthesis protein FlhF [Ideonella benzenivorans]
MNVKRFTARTSREAFALVRQAYGEDAVVLSTKPCAEGVEVLAMAPEAVNQLEKVAAPSAATRAARGESLSARAERQQAERSAAGQRRQADATEGDVNDDVERMAMSTLSFQDYVRDRMLRRRQAALDGKPVPVDEPVELDDAPAAPAPRRAPAAEPTLAARAAMPARRAPARPLDDGPAPELPVPTLSDVAPQEQIDMVHELRAMKGLIEERFGTLAFMEKLQREPRQAQLSQKLMDVGFSPALTRKLLEALPASATDELAWATSVLERNLLTGEHEPPLEDKGGVYAMIGSTGVGKTTSTAKLAAAFATAHGANQLGLITLDAYRMGAHEQLRAYGRILGVPVHTAHDRASLEDLLELLSGKKMVLIDTAGMAQRDSRCRELLEMLSHRSIQRLLVVNAAAQGETLDDVMTAWRASQCKGVILSKIDEAVKLAPALDALIRHRLKVVGAANGQRVPEDWHRLSANALMHRAMRGGGSAAYRVDTSDVQLVLSGLHRPTAGLQGLNF